MGEITQDGEFTAKQKLADIHDVVNGFGENVSSDEEE